MSLWQPWTRPLPCLRPVTPLWRGSQHPSLGLLAPSHKSHNHTCPRPPLPFLLSQASLVIATKSPPLPALPGLLGYRHQKPFPVPSLSFLSRPSLSASLFPTSSLSRGKFQRQGLEGLHVELHADPAKMAPRGAGVCISWAQEPGEGHQRRYRRDIRGFCRAQKQKSEAAWVSSLPFALCSLTPSA